MRTVEVPGGDLLSIGDVANFLGVRKSTIYNWRYRKTGPPALHVGGQLRWRLSDIEKWLVEQSQGRP
jgi:excisionase family DNA binding protein